MDANEWADRAKGHSGVMVSLDLPQTAAGPLSLYDDATDSLPEGVVPPDQLHVTLAYLGKVEDLAGQRDALVTAVHAFAAAHPPISGVVNGGGSFARNEETGLVASWAYFDSIALPAFRQALVEAIQNAGVPYAPTYGFIPHITLAYTSPENKPAISPPTLELTFDALNIHWGDEVMSFPFTGEAAKAANWAARRGETIAGNLARGEGGQFTAAGDGAAATPFDKVLSDYGLSEGDLDLLDALRNGEEVDPAKLEKLRAAGLVGTTEDGSPILNTAGRRLLAAAKAGDADVMASVLEKTKPKPKGGGGGKGKQPAKPKPDKNAEAAATLKKMRAILSRGGLTGDAFDAFTAFTDGGELTPAQARSLSQLGAVEVDTQGQSRLTIAGRQLLAAIKRGDSRRALDALSIGKDRVRRAQQSAQVKKPATSKPKPKTQQPVVRPQVAQATKAKEDAPFYHKIGTSSTQVCETCKFAQGRTCTRFKFAFEPGYVCDDWLPNIEKTRERLRDLQAQNAAANRATTEKAITKREGDVDRVVADYLVVEDPEKPSTWHLAFRTDGKPDPRLMGAAWAALTVGYRGNKYEGPQKDAALEKLRQVYEQMGRTPPGEKEKSMLTVFKDATGQYRWVGSSSNAFRDREGEIVSAKALGIGVSLADQSGNRGPLCWWHEDAAELGDCDFQAMHGRMLVESGTFRRPAVAQKVAAAEKSLRFSIRFKYPIRQRDKEGVYHLIVFKERSLLPAGRESNPFTTLSVKGDTIMDKEKEKALRLLLGDETTDIVLAQVEAKEKSVAGMGVSFKSQDELSKLNADDLLDYALAKKEAELAAKEEGEGGQGDEVRTDETAPVGQGEFRQLVEAINGLRDEFKAYATEMKAQMGSQAKEVDAAAQKVKEDQARATRLEKQIGILQTQLKELQGEQPRAKQPGYRPSRDGNPLPEKEADALKQTATDGVGLITQRILGANGS
ncbi:MAG: 2'-5' RNA ligase family protein [Candidatus Competibacter sp.]